MYQVIMMYGDTEPWWFLEGWEEDIIESHLFQTYDGALKEYRCLSNQFSKKYEHQETRKGCLTAFWNSGEEKWCEECGEFLQQFRSVMLVQLDESTPNGYQKREKGRRVKPCMLK